MRDKTIVKCNHNLINELHLYASIPSTHTEMLQNPVIGRALLSYEQTAGVGQQGRQWLTPNNNFALTFAIEDPNVEALSLVVAAGILSTLQKNYMANFKVKWPNDIYSNDKKLGGILIEKITASDKKIAIVSIGLNMLQNHLPENATSLEEITHSLPIYFKTPRDIFELIVPFVVQEIQNAEKNGMESAILQLNQNHILTNKTVEFEDGTSGVVEQISSDGALIVNGEKLYSGQIKAWK